MAKTENKIEKKRKVFFLLSHPTQYFSPLFREISLIPGIDFEALYCSDQTLNEYKDREFGVTISWDVPLLEGYDYKFLKNYSFNPTIYKFWGLLNLGLINVLRKEKGSILIIHGWHRFSLVFGLIIGKVFGLKVLLRSDNPELKEKAKSKKLVFLKRIVLGSLFKFPDKFLFVGQENKLFYQYYGVHENKLVFTPYAIENKRFLKEWERLKNSKISLRERLNLPVNKTIILFSGKYIPEKSLPDLIKAYEQIQTNDKALVLMGDGRLRHELESYVADHKLRDVYFTGFKNQSEIVQYFAAADIFVLASGMENWGLVVNEAMIFNLPVIVSDKVGCSKDLVENGKNGFVFPHGNISELTEKLQILIADENLRKRAGKKSEEIISEYSIEKIVNALEKLFYSI